MSARIPPTTHSCQQLAEALYFEATNLSGSNSAVECQLPKLDVAGSIPVSRSNLFNNLQELLTGYTPFLLH